MPGDAFIAKSLNRLVDIDKAWPEVTLDIELLRQYAVTKVFPQLTKEGIFVFQGNIEPDLTTKIMRHK